MQQIKQTTQVTINATATKLGADKVALRQVTLQGTANIIDSLTRLFIKSLPYLIMYLATQ